MTLICRSRYVLLSSSRGLRTSAVVLNEMGRPNPNLILVSTKNNVTTLKMNDPKKLNGWTGPMMLTLRDLFEKHGKSDETKALILTGADPYYCAGVNLNASIQPMHPRKLHALIKANNQALFEAFLDFPKPLIVAANGPAIGACVTSATLCDALIASEKATFHVPFAALAIPPEGCSSVHFERIMGPANAARMLKDGWKPSGKEAVEVGLATEVVPHEQLLTRAQEVAEGFVKANRRRTIPGGGSVEEYKKVNERESIELADAFLSTAFIDAQFRFLKSKGKTSKATMFWLLKTSRPIWSKML